MPEQTSGGTPSVGKHSCVVILPNKYYRDEIAQRLNGLQTRIHLQYGPESTQPEAKVLDLSRAESIDLGYLVNELGEGYRPDEVVYLLEQFVQGGDWKNSTRLLRQLNDRQILEAILRTVRSELLDCYLSPIGCGKEKSEQFGKELGVVSSRYRWIHDLYQGHESSLSEDLKRICATNALKVYVDRQEPPRGISTIHGALLDQIVLKHKFLERLPAEYYPVEEEQVASALRAAYIDRMKIDPTGIPAEMIRKDLGAEAVEQITNELHLKKKQAIIAHLQSSGIDDLLREETRVPGPSKNPVFAVRFSIADQSQLTAIVKVLDCRDEQTKEGKSKEFENEVRTIRYYERAGLLDPVNFVAGREDGIRIIAMNYLDSENLLDVMRRETPAVRQEFARELVRLGARFHAYGSKNLVTQPMSDNVRERAKYFAGRITGEHAMFFPNIVALLESQGMIVENKDILEQEIKEGLGDVLWALAEANGYDVTYCDFHWRNWFVRGAKDKQPAQCKWTKRDFGTLKVVPAQIDLVTPFVVGKYVRDKREEIYKDYFQAYNNAIEYVNQQVRQPSVDVRRFFMQQALRDFQKGTQAPEHAPPELAKEVYWYLRSRTQGDGFKFKEVFDGLKAQVGGADETKHQSVEDYLDDISVFLEGMRHKRQPFKDLDHFLFIAKTAEVKRGLVMSGFFSESALQHGLSQENLAEIKATLENAIEPLGALAERDEFKRKRDRIGKAKDGLLTLLNLAEKLTPKVQENK